MTPVVTLQGIDEAVSNLDYRNERGTKFRLVQAIRAQYEQADSIQSVKSIDSDQLIMMLWEGALDSTTIRNRRRNLSSIKSSVNADLKKLYRDGKNPEGITISSVNTFVMSDEAKDSALEALRGVSALEGGTRLDHLADAINTLKEALSSSENLSQLSRDEAPGALNELRDLIRSLSEKIEPEPSDEVLETIDEEDEGLMEEEIEEVEEADVEDPLDELELGEVEEFDEAELDEEDSGIEPAGELEEIDEAVSIEMEDAETLEDVDIEEDAEELDGEEFEDVEPSDEVEELAEELDEEVVEEEGIDSVDAVEEIGADEVIETSPEEILEDIEEIGEDEPDEVEEVEEFDTEALEEPPVEDVEFEENVTESAMSEGQEAEQGLEVVEAGDGSDGGGLGFTGDVGGNTDGAGLTDDFREEGLLEEAEKSGRLLKDFGEEALNGEPGSNQNQDRSRVLAEQFNRSLAAMDRFFNQYVLIPNGKYPVGKKRQVKGERSMQIIELPSFYMGKFPVTNALFEVFVEKTGYKTTAERTGYGTVYDGRVQREVDEETGLETYTWSSSLTNKVVKGACWYQPLGPGSTLHKKRNHPVVQVSLEDALAFAAWTGKGLPGEDEWEAASRTAKGFSLPWGSRWKKDVCNFEATSIGDTTAVDRFMDWENELGIADTLGNVWEWTSTTFKDGTESHVRSYIAKGGSWATSKPLDLTSRLRVDPKSHSNILGFRCVAY